jgi:hypothetical protein
MAKPLALERHSGFLSMLFRVAAALEPKIDFGMA